MSWRGCLLFVACAMPWTAWGSGSEAPAGGAASCEVSTEEASPGVQATQKGVPLAPGDAQPVQRVQPAAQAAQARLRALGYDNGFISTQ